MTSPPISECKDIDALVETEHAVHLIVRITGDWESAREETSAELERRTHAALSYAASPEFAARFGSRIGVVRAQTPRPAPTIVDTLMTEQGIELEDLSAPHPEDGPTCTFCGRERLPVALSGVSDRGWACLSCLRAWNQKTQPELFKKPRQFRIPPRLLWPLVILAAVLFAVGLYYELGQLNKMNRVIRQHVPQ